MGTEVYSHSLGDEHSYVRGEKPEGEGVLVHTTIRYYKILEKIGIVGMGEADTSKDTNPI